MAFTLVGMGHHLEAFTNEFRVQAHQKGGEQRNQGGDVSFITLVIDKEPPSANCRTAALEKELWPRGSESLDYPL